MVETSIKKERGAKASNPGKSFQPLSLRERKNLSNKKKSHSHLIKPE